MKAAILAGGYGKRLRPLTIDRPKPLIEVAGKPILQWQVEWLRRHGVSTVVFLVGYLKEKIIEYFGSGSKFGIKISYVVEDEPLGTAGALKNAEHILGEGSEIFLVLNGDILTNIDPTPLIERLKQQEDKLVAIATVPLRSPYGILRIGENDLIEEFIEKPLLKDYWINAGIYAMRPQVFNYIPEKGDIEKTAFPRLAEEHKILAVRYSDVFWKSIDTHKDIEEASKELKALGLI